MRLRRYSTKTLATLVLIFFGVCLYAGEGDVGGSNYGIALTLLGAFLAAAKGNTSSFCKVDKPIVTNAMVTNRRRNKSFDGWPPEASPFRSGSLHINVLGYCSFCGRNVSIVWVGIRPRAVWFRAS